MPSEVSTRRTCSRACDFKYRADAGIFKGFRNPRYLGEKLNKKCLTCGNYFKAYNKKRKYCGRVCYSDDPRRVRTGATYVCQKDLNHDSIVAEFERLGCVVEDTTCIGQGYPDIVVGLPGFMAVLLVEIKNPNSEYGRNGLSRAQARFAAKFSVDIVRTNEDVAQCVESLKTLKRALDAL